jgi:hypothetical protein
MNAPTQTPPPTTLQRLNQTPTGVAVTRLLKDSGMDLQGRLALAVLLEWATANLATHQGWARAVDQAAVLAETRDPEAMQRTLDAPGLAQAHSLEEAGRILLRWVADLIPPGTQAA